jgi:hypothetical protein
MRPALDIYPAGDLMCSLVHITNQTARSSAIGRMPADLSGLAARAPDIRKSRAQENCRHFHISEDRNRLAAASMCLQAAWRVFG